MIKNIIFDIGNVIAYIDYMESINELIEEKDREFIIDNVLHAPEWNDEDTLDMGYYSLDDFISIVGDRTDNTKDDLIKYYMYEHYKFLIVNTKVLDIIKKLKDKNYNVYILSNLNDIAYNIYKENGVFDNVDGSILSFKEHHIKPHKTIYKILLERYNLIPEESVFIDDKIENCETAKSLGIDYINVKPNDYDDLLSKLKNKIDI